jgi:Uma2 family endonuclease
MAASPVSSPPALLTLDEFAALPNAGDPMELVRGEVRPLSPAHGPASTVGANIFWLLSAHVRPRRLGRVYGDNAGFALLGAQHTSRSPDVAFIRAEQLPAKMPRGPIRIAPDLVVEVLSPNESTSDLEDKMIDYREAGTPLIWVVDPQRRFVTVHARDAAPHTLREGDTLTGGRVLPNFTCPVAELFEGV